MTVEIDLNSARITFAKWGMKPGVFIDRQPRADKYAIVFHCGEGFVPPNGGPLPPQNPAWIANGSVKVKLGAGDSLAGWKFGFIQLCRPNKMLERFAGRTPEDGSANVTPLEVGQLADRILIDAPSFDSAATQAANPFTDVPVMGAALRPPVLSCKTSDHPTMKIGASWENTKVGRGRNLFFKYFESTDFWTILSLMTPDGEFFHLAHFKWSLVHDVEVKNWTGDIVANLISRPKFDATAPIVASGPPAELAAGNFRLDGTDPAANDELRESLAKLKLAVPGLAVRQFDVWPQDLPKDFYQPLFK